MKKPRISKIVSVIIWEDLDGGYYVLILTKIKDIFFSFQAKKIKNFFKITQCFSFFSIC